MKKPLIIGGAIVLVALIIFASVRGGGSKGEIVYVEPVTQRNIQAIVTAPGEVDPKVKVNISAHIVGKIEKIYFAEGDSVKKGQRLVDLEKTAYQAAHSRAVAAGFKNPDERGAGENEIAPRKKARKRA